MLFFLNGGGAPLPFDFGVGFPPRLARDRDDFSGADAQGMLSRAQAMLGQASALSNEAQAYQATAAKINAVLPMYSVAGVGKSVAPVLSM